MFCSNCGDSVRGRREFGAVLRAVGRCREQRCQFAGRAQRRIGRNWASGSSGMVLRSEDDGSVWQNCTMPEGGERLDFRGVWAWDAEHAVVMSSGTGDVSRLYETTDGCATWHLLFQNPDASGFWDALCFV